MTTVSEREREVVTGVLFAGISLALFVWKLVREGAVSHPQLKTTVREFVDSIAEAETLELEE